uniref:RNA replicase n=1 Tax=Wenling noda-like virus 4 TaxID=1923514 RepID=A0A1L3KGV3_9VIRU|nr:hypothetical protein [Wenling noda-like virus 4]
MLFLIFFVLVFGLPGGGLAAYSCWVLTSRVSGMKVRDPYRGVMSEKQALLMNATRKDLAREFHPLSALTGNVQRHGDNGHPRSGSARDTARLLIDGFITANGFHKMEISPAPRHLSEDDVVVHYSPSDLRNQVSEGKLYDDSVVVGIDVDYYVDDWEQLLGYGHPAIFYTFSPLSVSGRDGECNFRIIDNVVHYEVDGGESWCHKLWNWTRAGSEFIETLEPLTTWRAKLNYLATGKRKVVYHRICHARPFKDAPHRALVWLIPESSCERYMEEPVNIVTKPLRRMNFKSPRNPEWNELVYNTTDKAMISIGRAGEDASIAIPKEECDVLLGVGCVQSVSSRMINWGYKPGCREISLFNQYYSKTNVVNHGTERLSRPIVPRPHWPVSSNEEKPETRFRAISKPILADESAVPQIKSEETFKQTVDVRVTRPKNRIETPPAKYASLAKEFIELVVPETGIGSPYSDADTLKMLDKKSQRLANATIADTMDIKPRSLLSSFVKSEPTMKAGRLIQSMDDPRYLFRLSQYTLAFRDDVLHKFRWFIPGSTPTKIASRIQEYVSEIDSPLEGDFSNFDGTVSRWLQTNVMNAVILRWVNVSQRDEARELLTNLIVTRAKSKRFNTYYDPGVGVKSGSPTTCDLNTVLNAFVQYCAVRLTTPTLDKAAAFRKIGLAFGDDSLFDETYTAEYQRAAERLGLCLKTPAFDPDKGVTFLARVYPDPWRTKTSFQDPERTLRKIHITARDPNVPLCDAAFDRVEGYLQTDTYTPIISAYCRLVKKWAEPLIVSHAKRKERQDRNEFNYWLKSTGEAWPQDENDVTLMTNCLAHRIGITAERVQELDKSLRDASSLEDIEPIERDHTDSPYKETVGPDGDLESPVGGVSPRNEQANAARTIESTNRQPEASVLKGPERGSGSRNRFGARISQKRPHGVFRFRSKASGTGVTKSEVSTGETRGRASAGGPRTTARKDHGAEVSRPNRTNCKDQASGPVRTYPGGRRQRS